MAAPRVPPTRRWNTPVKRGCPSTGRSLRSWQTTSRNGARRSRATRTGPAASLTQSTFLSIPDVIKRAAPVGPQRGPLRNQFLVPWQLRLPLHLTVHLPAVPPPLQAEAPAQPISPPALECRGLRRLQLCHRVDLCRWRVRPKAVVGCCRWRTTRCKAGTHTLTASQLKQMNREDARMS